MRPLLELSDLLFQLAGQGGFCSRPGHHAPAYRARVIIHKGKRGEGARARIARAVAVEALGNMPSQQCSLHGRKACSFPFSLCIWNSQGTGLASGHGFAGCGKALWRATEGRGFRVYLAELSCTDPKCENL